MTITPQNIKDTEFRTKMRGYDVVEVRTFLERIAEEYLGHIEQEKDRERRISELRDENDRLLAENEGWANEVARSREANEQLTEEHRLQKEQYEKQKRKIKTCQLTIDRLQQENLDILSKFGLVQKRLKGMKTIVVKERTLNKKMLNKIHSLESQNEQAKKEEAYLKKTLAAANKFSEDLIQKSEQQASDIFNSTRREIERLRSEAKEELAYFPTEIKRMKEEYDMVRNQLRTIVSQYLESLDSNIAKEKSHQEGKQESLFRERNSQVGGQEQKEGSLEKRSRADGSHLSSVHDFETEDQLFQSIRIPDDV